MNWGVSEFARDKNPSVAIRGAAGRSRRGVCRIGKAGLDAAWQARRGLAWIGMVGLGLAGLAGLGLAKHGWAWCCMAGMVRHVLACCGRYGLAWQIKVGKEINH